MSSSFYPKMAVNNLKKNGKIFLPYILMGIFTIMMYFMIVMIINNKNVNEMNHSSYIIVMLNIALWVVRIFSVIFIFYINSFLMKRRQKEIGLYNILGMGKPHIAKVLFFENVYTMLIAIIGGIIAGIVFGRLIFLLLFKLIKSDTLPEFTVPLQAIVSTVVFFAAVYFITFIYNLFKVHLSKPVELLHGGQIGEKEPKTKIILTIIGVLCLGFGYYFALFTKSPLEAMGKFLIAVILVIIGTYALFTAGSIAVLKLLRKNKNFYYKSKHFTTISGMIYRMKQNAVGLANICILSTMVLISISTTVCLYASMEDTLNSEYPYEISASAKISDRNYTALIDNEIEKINTKYGVKEKLYKSAAYAQTMLIKCGNGTYEVMNGNIANYKASTNFAYFNFIDLDTFNKISGSNYKLSEGEVLGYNKKGFQDNKITIDFKQSKMEFNVSECLTKDKFEDSLDASSYESIMDYCFIVVKDADAVENIINSLSLSNTAVSYNYSIRYDTELSKEDVKKVSDDISALDIQTDGDCIVYCNNRYDIEQEMHQVYGGFLFIGLFVGILFFMATAIIIYYKQISEGYDDRERFEIMQKVGMSHEEVKKTIHSQILMVFFIPLAGAGIHVAVAYRIIKQILNMLSFGNSSIFIQCSIFTFLIFALIYILIFMLTAKAYYRIVVTKE